MKVGIDSYCYHRFFGEVYPDQKKPAKNMTMEDFLKRAHALKVDGVSLESCFFPSTDAGWFKELKAQLPGDTRMGWNVERTGKPMMKW
jgi:hypothetical protein